MLFSNISYAQYVPAFPSAEGYGRYASGGRNGKINIVTNLNDSGKGSLREAISKNEKRTIVFATSGTIYLKSPLNINHGNLTILGQTSPGEGITIANYPVTLKDNNIILRYLRFRLGDLEKVEGDALGGRNIENIIVDHCSISWATDENISFYNIKNITIQWSIISEALNQSVHHKGAHGYGGIWGGAPGSYHHNLIMSNNSRNPRFSGSSSTLNSENELVDFRNNVIYNWGDNSIYGGEKGKYNLINNYFEAGPATKHKNRIVNPSKPYGKFYISGNYVKNYPNISENNWKGGVQNAEIDSVYTPVEFVTDKIKTNSALEAFELVKRFAGSSLMRDDVDKRLIHTINTGYEKSTTGIINSQKDVGGFPLLKTSNLIKDVDQDGIDDNWELKHNLKVGINDANNYDLSAQYTNIEVYAESLVNEISTGQSKHSEEYVFKVSPDGKSEFKTIQEAIIAAPDFSKVPIKIFIKSGTYREKLNLSPSKTNIHLIGEDKANTIITYDDFAQKLNILNQEIGTSGSATFFVFGDQFTAENITFKNEAGTVGQAVAVRIDADKVKFINCNFIGNQDTLYLVKPYSRNYFKSCYIEGTVDYIFGSATAYFEDCHLHNKAKGYITAASTPQDAKFGFVFYNTKITGENITSHYLGRPWRPYAKTVFINTTIDQSVKPEGWNNWGKDSNEETTYYAEYNTVNNNHKQNRVKWSHTLQQKDIIEYTINNIFNNWKP